MRATLRDNRPEEIDRRVTVRLARRRLLSQDPEPLLWAVVDEAALRLPVGDIKVLRASSTGPLVATHHLAVSAGPDPGIIRAMHARPPAGKGQGCR